MSDENSTKPSYKLYAMEATYDNVLVATKEKYYRITAAGVARINDFKEEWKEVIQIYRFVAREDQGGPV